MSENRQISYKSNFGEQLAQNGYANLGYEAYFQLHGIGDPYVDQCMLDSPPPVRSGLLTIPQVLAMIGKAEFGERWQDWERKALNYPQPVMKPFETRERLRDLQTLDAPKAPPKGVPLSTARRSAGTRQIDNTNSQEDYASRLKAWGEGQEGREAEIESTLNRVNDLHLEWERAADEGSDNAEGVRALYSAYRVLARAVSDGKVHPIFQPRAVQGEQTLEPQFFLLESNAAQAIRYSTIMQSNAETGFKEPAGWILVPEDEIRALLQSPPEALINGVETKDLSSYLQLAIHVHSLGYGPPFEGNKKSIRQALVENAGQFGLELSLREEEYLATFLRNSDAKGGKAKKIALAKHIGLHPYLSI